MARLVSYTRTQTRSAEKVPQTRSRSEAETTKRSTHSAHPPGYRYTAISLRLGCSEENGVSCCVQADRRSRIARVLCVNRCAVSAEYRRIVFARCGALRSLLVVCARALCVYVRGIGAIGVSFLSDAIEYIWTVLHCVRCV